MGAASAVSDQSDFIPATMAELAEHYYDLIIGMVRKSGIPDQDAPDAAQYILERLAKTDVIGQYDPDHLVEHQGQQRKVRFSTFLGAKVLLYCRGERGRVQRRASRELPVLDLLAERDAAGGGLCSPDLIARTALEDDYSGLEAEEFITQIRARLAQVPPRSSRDPCDLAALFDELVQEISETGQYSYAAIQDRFGISGTTAWIWMARLRQVLARMTGRPAAVIGGISLNHDQVAAAVKILREARGIMVAQPLAKAGHPLAEAEKGWYHAFAAEELRKFPKLVVDPGTHRKPTGHVKIAVIHRLERILAESGVQYQDPAPPVPESRAADPEPVSPEDELEAALWRFVRDVEDVDRIKALARRAYAVAG